MPDLPHVSPRLHELFSLDADAEQSGLNAVKEHSLGVFQPHGNRLQGPAVTSEIQQSAPAALFLGLTAGAEGEAGQNPQAQQDQQEQRD